jgi:hypothetical protein
VWPVYFIATPLIPGAIRTLATSPPFAYPQAVMEKSPLFYDIVLPFYAEHKY